MLNDINEKTFVTEAQGEMPFLEFGAEELLKKVLKKTLFISNNSSVKTLFIEPGSPWENGYIESFNGKLRDELLNGEIFTTLLEAKVLLENWRREYNQIRPHSSPGNRPPTPEAIRPFYIQKSITLGVVLLLNAGQ
jgi:hypothetical protein